MQTLVRQSAQFVTDPLGKSQPVQIFPHNFSYARIARQLHNEVSSCGPTGDYCRRTSVDLKVHCYSNPVDSESWLAQEHAQLPCSGSDEQDEVNGGENNSSVFVVRTCVDMNRSLSMITPRSRTCFEGVIHAPAI